METKFEYQVSPEIAEQIALEQYDVLLRARVLKLKYLPLTIGFLLALLSFCISNLSYFLRLPRYYSTWSFGGSSYAFSDSFVWVVVGFVIGFVFGLAFRFFLYSALLGAARSAYKTMGPTRTVSWNSELIAFQFPSYEIKIHWEIIDRIEIGPLGVYGFSGRRTLFIIPSEVFPSNATAQDLIKTWQSGKQQYPITA